LFKDVANTARCSAILSDLENPPARLSLRPVKQGLIFDLDGTLVDSLPGIAASLNHALGTVGLPGHVHADVRRFIGNGSRILVKRAAPTDTPDSLLDQIENAFKIHYDANWASGTTPYAGIPAVLKTLHERGYPLAILSNKPHPFTADIARTVFPDIPFDVVCGQRNGIPHKPDPTGARGIIEAFSLPAEACVLIGDSTIDLETSRNAGIGSVAVTWGYHDRAPLLEGKPDQLIDTPEELGKLFPSEPRL
jgi:phosphoglycolate phosphatase